MVSKSNIQWQICCGVAMRIIGSAVKRGRSGNRPHIWLTLRDSELLDVLLKIDPFVEQRNERLTLVGPASMASAGKRGRKGKGNKRKNKVFKAKDRWEMLSTLEDKAAADYDDLANNAIASLEGGLHLRRYPLRSAFVRTICHKPVRTTLVVYKADGSVLLRTVQNVYKRQALRSLWTKMVWTRAWLLPIRSRFQHKLIKHRLVWSRVQRSKEYIFVSASSV